MKTVDFKTYIMCGACIEKVTPVLNSLCGDTNWKVDIKDPRKILTVSGENANAQPVIDALNKVGYKAEQVK